MNVYANLVEADGADREEAAAALAILRRFIAANPAEAGRMDLDLWHDGVLRRDYDADFIADEAYRATLPDMQNAPEEAISGLKAPIQHVGISNFRLPLRWKLRGGEALLLETAVTGAVSLAATQKGINMSRIMRSFYKDAEREFGFEAIEDILARYGEDLGGDGARLALAIRAPLMKPSLRSGLEGWQYYDVIHEVARSGGVSRRVMHLDYVYASTCPCSLELAEHARHERGVLAVAHSQRSVARISVLLKEGETLPFEDIVDICREAVPTETQTMVKREDEQAFAELNGANPVFVEDAVRLFAGALSADGRISDFRIAASHQESLHSHDAVSIMTKGPWFASVTIEPHLFGSLIHRNAAP